jgi:phospholipase/lecithinase/hemolysin
MKPSQFTRIAAAVAVSACALSSAPVYATSFTNLVVFGDSLSDPGNASALSFGAFPGTPNGRVSNGPVAAEYLAASFGASTIKGWALPVGDPVPAGANNFAVVGARTIGTGNYRVQLNDPPGLGTAFPALAETGVSKQIERYNPAGFDPDKTLHLLWSAPNDFFAGIDVQYKLGIPVDFPALAEDVVLSLGDHIGALVAKGAKHILVPNMPDLGLTPEALALGPSFAGLATSLTDGFNAGLDTLLGQAGAQLAPLGVTLYDFDTAGLFRNVVAHPAAFGFSNVTEQCVLSAAALQSNCAGYFFFNGVHPTTAAHETLAKGFAAAVPEPETYALFALGLVAVGWAARRRAMQA